MNLFTGMSDHQIVSAILDFVLFNLFVALVAAALYAFYVASRPRRGRVYSAAIWHVVAVIWFIMALIATVWAAPAEKAFVDVNQPDQPFFAGERFTKVIIGLIFAAIGLASMVVGVLQGRAQRRRAAQQALLEA